MDVNISRRTIPPAEIYPSISPALHVAQTDDIKSWGIRVTPLFGRLEIDGVIVLPTQGGLDSWPGFEQNDSRVMIPDLRFGAKVRGPAQRSVS